MSERKDIIGRTCCLFSSCQFFLLALLLLVLTGQVVDGETLERDKEVLLELKSYLQRNNLIYRGDYARWSDSDPTPCNWAGITCENGRVSRVNLSNSSISGLLFPGFSRLTALTHLDLSKNTISGDIPPDLNQCRGLRHLNLSHNIIDGELRLPALTNLEVLDLTLNRFAGGIGPNFPGICSSLVTLNISMNNFTGNITDTFDSCSKLRYLDLSTNRFTGNLRNAISGLAELSVAENNLVGAIAEDTFQEGCGLRVLDMAQNQLYGEFPGTIANCRNLTNLNLWGNDFTGRIPSSIGSLPSIQMLLLGNNTFDRDIPVALLNCSNLTFLDLSRNNFSGEVQPIFGQFKQLKFLVLHNNRYIGGIEKSGILDLPSITRLDLSYNSFTGSLPMGLVRMSNLKYLFLGCNNFSGNILPEFGNMSSLQMLDLSSNQLTGSIPASIGNLTSLLWLMLADNSLTGEIPTEIGKCQSLLWLNLANNRLTGRIPQEISTIGRDPSGPFELNRRNGRYSAGSGECLTMKRWLPARYPPFSFIYESLTRKSCRSRWDRILRGYGLFPLCAKRPAYRTTVISGYIQLTGNLLSGEIPPQIGGLGNFSLVHLNRNKFSGRLPAEISRLPLAVLNVSENNLSGAIPQELGNITCLQNLDLSLNNFSGELPMSLNLLSELSKFNVSFNPQLSGVIPKTGQLSTFGDESFMGDTLIVRGYNNGAVPVPPAGEQWGQRRPGKSSPKVVAFYIFLGLCSAFLALGVVTFVLCVGIRPPNHHHQDDPSLMEDGSSSKLAMLHARSPSMSTEGASSSSSNIKVFRLKEAGAFFTYADIVRTTNNFSDDMVIGSGGFGTVYRGVLPDGSRVAVKKLQSGGAEGEKEFRAEMEVLSRMAPPTADGGWPHPNLVALFGWCLSGSEKLLVYEFMEGGSLDEVILDWKRLGWQRRVDVAVGVARALVFLHHECYPAVVHRDVKASNVLLDGEGRARVTDFGLARVVRPEETHVSTMVAGTVGYVAPEYGQTWQATTKGDVYSFGVLAMELATGRRAVGEDGGEGECLVEWARRVCREEGGCRTEEGGEEEGKEEMRELVRIGLRCTADAPQARPNMKEVLLMLVRILPPDQGEEGMTLTES